MKYDVNMSARQTLLAIVLGSIVMLDSSFIYAKDEKAASAQTATAGQKTTEPANSAAEQLSPQQQETAALFMRAQVGPQAITLKDQAKLNLPKGFRFLSSHDANQFLKLTGNPPDQNLIGIIVPDGGESDWFATLEYKAQGYIKDDDAKDWNAEDLLKSYREGTEAGNEQRRANHQPELELMGWAEKPQYNAGKHHLVWALDAKEKGSADHSHGVNYNTLVLGREGYMELDIVTGLSELPQAKKDATNLLSAIAFNDGKRYEDFNPSTDKLAEYGLTALIVGVGAKKLGLFAVIAAFVAKFAKLLIIGVLGLGAAIKAFFSRKKG